MSVQIENRPYDSDCTEEEREALRARVCLYQDNIVMMKEVPKQTVFQLNLAWEKLREVTVSLPKYHLIIDLTEANRPDGKVRAHLKSLFAEEDKLQHVVVYTGKNFMLSIAAQFVFRGLHVRSFSVHRSLEEAVKELKNYAH